MPFLISWPAKIAAGGTDNSSVICSLDLFPSLCTVTGAKYPAGFTAAGEDMSKALLGVGPVKRSGDIMWDFGRNRFFGRPPQPQHHSPHLAIRRGDWKLLVNSDGSRVELYNIAEDMNESVNIAHRHPQLTAELKNKVIDWYVTKRKVRE